MLMRSLETAKFDLPCKLFDGYLGINQFEPFPKNIKLYERKITEGMSITPIHSVVGMITELSKFDLNACQRREQSVNKITQDGKSPEGNR